MPTGVCPEGDPALRSPNSESSEYHEFADSHKVSGADRIEIDTTGDVVAAGISAVPGYAL